MKKRLVAVSLLTLALTACGGGKGTDIRSSWGKYPVADLQLSGNVVDPTEQTDAHLIKSAELYNANYGTFYTNYALADDASSVSERYVYQALAEAKLLENGTLLPGTANGGNYAMTRVVPKTVTPCLWGNDNMRYHNMIVKKGGNPFTAAERTELQGIYASIAADESVAAEDKQSTYETRVDAWFAEKGYEADDNYTQYYDGDPDVYDIHSSYYAVDAEPLVNTFDGLVEYDTFNNIRGALADSWTVSPDGTQYTFHIREGAVWTDRTGQKVADVKADDFVAGFQHMLDFPEGELTYLVEDLIVGAGDYFYEPVETKDFSIVGVVADEAANTVTYTLTAPTSYFMTMLGYSIFAPMSRSYYESQGGKFGSEFDPEDESYVYASDYSHIAYCGPYLIKTFTQASTFEFEANPLYWNADGIRLNSIVWLENDSSDPLKAYNGMKSGEVAGSGLNPNAVALAKTENMFDTYSYVSDCDANSYPFYINMNRSAYANYNDATKGVSPKTAEDRAVCEAAMKNAYVRLGLAFAIDRVAYYAASVGEELAATSMTNSYTPGTFVQTTEPVTVTINGVQVTFPAGTYYGAIMQYQLSADGMPMKVWDPTAEGGVGSGYGFDGWHNVDAAVSYMNKGIKQLAATGVEISTEKPLVIELTTASAVTTTDNAIKAVGEGITRAFNGLVKVIYNDCITRADMLRAEYYPNKGNLTNCDIMTISGWGPDYGDPSTYLDTFLPQAGGMLKCSGIY